MANKVNIPSNVQNEVTLSGVAQWLLTAYLPENKILESQRKVEVGSAKVDLRVKAKIGGITKTFLCEVKSKGEPKYLFNAIGQLALAMKRYSNSYPVVVTPSLSNEGRNVLREAGVGYVTLDGEVYLKFDTVLVDRTARPILIEKTTEAGEETTNRRKLKDLQNLIEETLHKRLRRILPFPFSPKASRVVRLFVEYPDRAWTIRNLADEAQVALRLALRVVNTLDEKGYIKKERGATRLLKRKELLDVWAENYKFTEANNLRFFYSLARNIDEFTAKLKVLPQSLRQNYCLTMFAGASLIAPQLRYNEVHLYISGDINEWAKALDITPVETGANMVLAIPFDDSVFYGKQIKGGVAVASNVQLYLDLYNLNDRAREQAEVLYRQSVERQKNQ